MNLLKKLEPPTRLEFAEIFVQRHGEMLKYDHQRRQFLYFEVTRWYPDVDGMAPRLVIAQVREAMKYVSAYKKLKRVGRFVRTLASGSGIEGILQIAKQQPPVTHAGGGWDPDPLVVAAPNGVIDLRTGTLRQGKPADRITLSVRPPYVNAGEQGAECPVWIQAVLDMCEEDQVLAEYLQRAVGYSITGLNEEQACWMLFGPGSNGKSTFVETIAYVMGDYAWSAPSSTFDHGNRYGIPNDLASLAGRRFVIALSEAGAAGGTRLNEARIKQVTGGDTLTARRLYAEFSQFQPECKLWLTFNERPRIRDDSYGMWRRVRLIELRRQFKPDPTLKDRLRTEAPGILRWIVNGSVAYLRDGLTTPPAVQEATDRYRQESDPLAGFLVECTELGTSEDTVRAKDLYQRYKTWATENGVSIGDRLDPTAFGTRMKERWDWKRTNQGIQYLGLVLRRTRPLG